MSQQQTRWGSLMIRILLSAIALLACVYAEAQIVVPTTFDTMYIPQGFDSNDSVQIVGEGAFRNSCYRPSNTYFKVDHQNKIVNISPSAFEYYGFCLQVILPFDRVLDIGILEPGTYKVVQNGQTIGKIPIRGSSVMTPDDFMYAAVEQAFIVKSQGSYTWGIVGELTNSCMYLDDVKITVEENVIVLQPIVKMEAHGTCRDGLFQFSKTGKISAPRGRYLLHVRSLNGKAINSLVNIY
jgi:hypothetical protein